MKKKFYLFIVTLILICTAVSAQTKNLQGEKDVKNSTHLLGGLSPEAALDYMKTTKNLVIVEVNTARWKKAVPFTGAMWIPHDEMEKRCKEIPSGRPVILHCGLGVVSVPAYEILIKMRPDIPELSYIDGAPMIAEYNEWIASGGAKR